MTRLLVTDGHPETTFVGDLEAPAITPLGSLDDDDQAIDSLQLDETPKSIALTIYKPF
jgi:hypothetical protein